MGETTKVHLKTNQTMVTLLRIPELLPLKSTVEGGKPGAKCHILDVHKGCMEAVQEVRSTPTALECHCSQLCAAKENPCSFHFEMQRCRSGKARTLKPQAPWIVTGSNPHKIQCNTALYSVEQRIKKVDGTCEIVALPPLTPKHLLMKPALPETPVSPVKVSGRGIDRLENVKQFLTTSEGRKWRIEKTQLFEDIHHFRDILKIKHHLVAPRDKWLDVLPPKDDPNYGFCAFFLLFCSAGLNDKSLLPFCDNFFKKFPVSPQWILDVGGDTLPSLMKKLSKQCMNAERLLAICRDLVDNFDGQIPHRLEDLTKCEGVGRKIGILTLQTVYGMSPGVPVDRHLERVFKELFMHDNKVSGPDEIGLHVEQWLPHRWWRHANDDVAGLCQLCADSSKREVLFKELAENKDEIYSKDLIKAVRAIDRLSTRRR